ncbi:hypothetical protein [Micromonospora sp. NPDC000668]|uniref:hypothetical protein n=1 Tax=Micromonospora sp. NPDC000668 TaxID=3364219 RepID=UPI0036965444
MQEQPPSEPTRREPADRARRRPPRATFTPPTDEQSVDAAAPTSGPTVASATPGGQRPRRAKAAPAVLFQPPDPDLQLPRQPVPTPAAGSGTKPADQPSSSDARTVEQRGPREREAASGAEPGPTDPETGSGERLNTTEPTGPGSSVAPADERAPEASPEQPADPPTRTPKSRTSRATPVRKAATTKAARASVEASSTTPPSPDAPPTAPEAAIPTKRTATPTAPRATPNEPIVKPITPAATPTKRAASPTKRATSTRKSVTPKKAVPAPTPHPPAEQPPAEQPPAEQPPAEQPPAEQASATAVPDNPAPTAPAQPAEQQTAGDERDSAHVMPASSRTPESELRAVTARLLDHPGFAPELLALAAVRSLGPAAADWAERLRTRYPDAPADGLARLATRRFVRSAGAGGAVAALAGLFAPLAELTSVLWTHSNLVLHLAAAYGQDPAHPDRAAELLVLTQVHPDTASARAALAAARAAGDPADGTWARAAEAAWRLAAPLTAQAGGWLALRLASRLLPGAAVLATALGDAAAADRLAARAVAVYRRAPAAPVTG